MANKKPATAPKAPAKRYIATHSFVTEAGRRVPAGGEVKASEIPDLAYCVRTGHLVETEGG